MFKGHVAGTSQSEVDASGGRVKEYLPGLLAYLAFSQRLGLIRQKESSASGIGSS
jgi:hypothetical protein